jgi:hypothetical protein
MEVDQVILSTPFHSRHKRPSVFDQYLPGAEIGPSGLTHLPFK